MYTPERDDDLPRTFHVGVTFPPPPAGGGGGFNVYEVLSFLRVPKNNTQMTSSSLLNSQFTFFH